MRPTANGEETVPVARGFDLDRPQPLAGGEQLKKFMSGLREVGHDLSCSPRCPGGAQVREGQQVAPNPLLSKANDTLQSSVMAVWRCIITDFGRLNFRSSHRKYIL